MFAYCNNRVVCFKDITGEDAIWIQEGKSAGYAGHTGLMVQDGDGNWWYFYWGPDDSGDLGIKTTVNAISGQAISNGCYIIPVETTTDDLKKPGGVKMAVKGAIEKHGGSPDRYDNLSTAFYFNGDYTATYDYLSELVSHRDERDYFLYWDNCVEESSYALSKSNKAFLLLYSNPFTTVIPNAAFGALSLYDKILGAGVSRLEP
jgi:hypothetical protein